jgi:hypothetical protein
MRRAIFDGVLRGIPLVVHEFVEHWEFGDQRARLARMFNHQKMREAAFTPQNKKNPTPIEIALVDIITAFGQLQADATGRTTMWAGML